MAKSEIMATISVEEREVYAEYLKAVRRQERRQTIVIVLLSALVIVQMLGFFLRQ